MSSKASKKPLSALLLLPPPPLNLLYPVLKATYNKPLSLVLSHVSKHASKLLSFAVLEIAVPCSDHYLLQGSQRPMYDQIQKLLAGLYRLVSVICARDSISVEGNGGVDARILLIAYSRDDRYSSNEGLSPAKPLQGPVIDLPTLAFSQRGWQHLFSVRSEEGKILLEQFLCLADQTNSPATAQSHWDVEEVDPGVSVTIPTEEIRDVQLPEREGKAHYSIAVGGTFDHLHAGHKLLLTMATLLLQPPSQSGQRRRIVIGITQDELLKNKRYAEFLESWDTRQQNVSNFLLALLDYATPGATPPAIYQVSRVGLNGEVINMKLDPALEIECVAISDPYGPTITDMSISALVVSGETRGGGQAVNKMRKELGWPPLEVFEVDVLEAKEPGDRQWANEGFDDKISSTEQRRCQSERANRLQGSMQG